MENIRNEIKDHDEIKKPSMYNVYLLNDDYTPMDFVIAIIQKIFHKTMQEAEHIMWEGHNTGRSFVGTFTYDIAETKTLQVQVNARRYGFPLCALYEQE